LKELENTLLACQKSKEEMLEAIRAKIYKPKDPSEQQNGN
jgi:hypothetical protein